MRALMLSGWSFQPYVVVSLVIANLWYLAGLIRMRRHLRPGRGTTPAHSAAFAAGVATLAIALLSPIDMLGEQLFCVHMVQHLLLMLVAAPLLVWSRPVVVFVWALPRSWRRGVGRAWTGFGARSAVNGLMHPVVVWFLFAGAFVFWHCPGPYTAALGNEFLHALEHLSFLVTALMFWSIVLAAAGHRRLSYGATLIFVITTAVLSGLPGALMILTTRPLYPVHEAGAALWGMTATEDQQLAGLVMWIPAGFVYLVAASYVFVRWLQDAERRLSSARSRPALLSLACVLVLPLLSGCDRGNAKAMAATIGNPRDGAKAIRQYGCGSCHAIPGIPNADGVVGPPLTAIGRRIYLAGLLRNTPENMVRWLRFPQDVVAGNAMPDMGLTERDAKNVAAYLYTLR